MRYINPIVMLCLLSTAAAQQPASKETAESPPTGLEQQRVEEGPPEYEAYLRFRRWVNSQPEEVRQGGEVFNAYREYLKSQGHESSEIDHELDLLREGGRRQEVEIWNRVLTSENPRFNTDPNGFLVRMVQGVEPGTALDVGMGQGRNSIYLAQQGWEVTGFDPAEKAVALAEDLAEEAGVKIQTFIQGSEDFDWGVEKWDLILLSYVGARAHVADVFRALRPGGLLVLEAFHDDATKNASIGRGVVYESNELLDLFSELRIIQYEDTADVADFGKRNTRVVRLCAKKE